jgi:AhpD family alkylhydroperoxidase
MRIDYAAVMPSTMQAMLGLQRAADSGGLDPELAELVKIRASQINGCAFCLDMHTKDARAIGAAEQRLYLLNAWRDAPCYSQRERSALAWCESLTLLPGRGAPEDVYQELVKNFSADEIAALTLQIVAINGWNRLQVGFSRPVGDYVSHRRPRQAGEPRDVSR